jgi:polyphosphate glucokinase
MEILGIDVGASGIKGAPVNTEIGEMLAPRFRVVTPQPSEPQAVAEASAQIVQNFDWHGAIGCGFPSAMRQGVVMTAANIDESWVGVNAEQLFSEATGCPTRVINDADAAGLAEITFGAGRGHRGVVLVVTIGTGLGTAMFVDGRLVPNMEMGHIEIDGQDAESRASDAARKREDLSWKKWAKRFNIYLNTLEKLLWPDLIILGGGTSKDYEKFMPYLTLKAEVIPAQFFNEAGIVGAALAARTTQDE